MYGFKAGAAPKDKPKGGKIKGPGTGTSDSIKTKVPSGTYIMPADSTEQIGEKTLGELGKPVPVNVSNGEYQMPPEQVHAVGAQVLDQMKDATHTPVAAMGFKPQEGELYFADGGAVESTDDLIARISAKYGTGGGSSPRPQPTAVPAPQQPAQRPATPSIGSAADALRNRKRQIAEAAGFADGGLVDDEQRSRTGPSPQMGAVALGNQARVERLGGQGMYESANREIAQGVRGAFQNTDTAIRGASQNISDAYQAGGIPAAIGATVRNTAVPALGFAADVGRGVKTLIDPAANALKTAVTGDPTPIDGTRSAAGFPTQHRSQPSTRAAAPQRQAGDPARPPAAQGFNPSALTEQQRNDAGEAYRSAWQREAPAGMRGANDQALGFYNAEQQVRGSNITARRGANGEMEFSGNGEGALPQSYTQGFDMALGNERMASANATRQGMTAPESGQGYGFGRQGPSGGVIGDSSSAQRERKRLVDAASTPYRGAQSGQLTANQLRTLAGLQEMDQRATTEAANQQAATERTAMQEAGANTRAFSRDQIDSRRVASEERVRDYEARGLERVEKLYTAYENAKTPEERAAIAEQIRAMNGKGAPNRYTVVPGGQEVTPQGMLRTVPSRVLNNQTGQFVEQPSGPSMQFEEGKVYVDASGNRATFRNGQWVDA